LATLAEQGVELAGPHEALDVVGLRDLDLQELGQGPDVVAVPEELGSLRVVEVGALLALETIELGPRGLEGREVVSEADLHGQGSSPSADVREGKGPGAAWVVTPLSAGIPENLTNPCIAARILLRFALSSRMQRPSRPHAPV